ncbi:uncharacterized protein HaLaN_28858, partial [Haematococcus lacustris]
MSTLTDQVEAPASGLDLLSARLLERRIQVEKEVLKYGEAPAGIKEVFELCRGFERAYVSFVNTCRQADGYQPHLMSPENGMRQLACNALDQVAGPVQACVQAVYTLLLNAAR